MGDLVGPSGEAITDAAVFAGHYLLPSDTCPTGAIQRSLSTGERSNIRTENVLSNRVSRAVKYSQSDQIYRMVKRPPKPRSFNYFFNVLRSYNHSGVM